MNQKGYAKVVVIVILALAAGIDLSCWQNAGKDTKALRLSAKDLALSDAAPKVVELIVGSWQSVDDEKSVVIYRTDGTFSDIYADEELNIGTWSIASSTLQTNIGDEEFTYSILDIGDEELVLSYLPRGNTLRFIRLNE